MPNTTISSIRYLPIAITCIWHPKRLIRTFSNAAYFRCVFISLLNKGTSHHCHVCTYARMCARLPNSVISNRRIVEQVLWKLTELKVGCRTTSYTICHHDAFLWKRAIGFMKCQKIVRVPCRRVFQPRFVGILLRSGRREGNFSCNFFTDGWII